MASPPTRPALRETLFALWGKPDGRIKRKPSARSAHAPDPQVAGKDPGRIGDRGVRRINRTY